MSFIGCTERNPRTLESVAVKEVFQGQTVWDRIVEVFELRDHPKTHRAYAWSHDTDNPKQPKRHVTVLHIPPALSPQAAVRAVIVKEFRDAQSI
ncbi:MAG: hypothetical protein ACJ74Z_01200 [Bryobacteraceae bacterium]